MQPVRVRYTGMPRSPEETARLLELLATGAARLLNQAVPMGEVDVDLSAHLSVHSDDEHNQPLGAPTA